ncbi:hypothetical protein [Staphylococcus pseudintermedius]|uniref:hypothetical protein n=1 Tax=Staphylococcus pseudintermedius TaxID=283734 RepID=UPI00286DDA36|nr:hypothetical protein [Staphylococcus pseudintermedius]WMZ81386.1 hypothetical protein QS418_12935 [Staphylococcus pseudintermedius]
MKPNANVCQNIILAPSLVVLPFDASLLNEFTADTNSLASVLTASLVDVDADVDALADKQFFRYL